MHGEISYVDGVDEFSYKVSSNELFFGCFAYDVSLVIESLSMCSVVHRAETIHAKAHGDSGIVI